MKSNFMNIAFLLLVFYIAPASVAPEKESCTVKGEWNLSFVAYKGDTLFVRNEPSYTMNYNLKRIKAMSDTLLSEEQLQKINLDAMTAYENYSKVKITFSRSTFSTTKVKRNGSIMNEVHEGKYKNINDTIYLNFTTRNDKEALFLDCKKESLILLKDSGPVIAYERSEK